MNQQELIELEQHIQTSIIESSDVKTKLFDLIKGVPQVEHINIENAKYWIDRVMDSPIKLLFGEEHILWHAKRLYGIGGSEMGCVIGHLFEYEDPFKTRQEIIMDKLMMEPPVNFSGDTLRGNLLEKVFEETSESRLAEHTKGFERIEEDDVQEIISQSDHHEKHPWLVGNPDFVYNINNRRFIDDFKIPRTGLASEYAEKGKLPFNYIAQIHHYAMCLNQGLDNVRMGLLSYDFGLAEPMLTGMIKRAIEHEDYTTISQNVSDWASKVIECEREQKADNPFGARLHRQNIPVSAVVCDAIRSEGDRMWNQIQKGYDIAMENEIDYLGVKSEMIIEAPEMVERANKIALRRKAADAIYKQTKDDASDFSDELKVRSDVRIRVGNVTLSAPTKRKKVTDNAKAIQLLNQYKIPKADVSSLDNDKVIDALNNAMGSAALKKSGVIYEAIGHRTLRFPTSVSKAYKNDLLPSIQDTSEQFELTIDQSISDRKAEKVLEDKAKPKTKMDDSIIDEMHDYDNMDAAAISM